MVKQLCVRTCVARNVNLEDYTDLTADALAKNPKLDGLEAFVPDSGEGRWTVTEAIDLNISAPVITESLIRRLRSREENNFTDRMISIMRGAFGGHDVKKS